MAAWRRLFVKSRLTTRAPKEGSLFKWAAGEAHGLLEKVPRLLDWAIGYLGMVGIDLTDEPKVLEEKVFGSESVTVTKSGDEGDRILTLAAVVPLPNDKYDFVFCIPRLTNAGEILAAWPVLRDVTIPAGFTGAVGKVLGNLPTGDVSLTVKQWSLTDVATVIGTADITAGTRPVICTVAAETNLLAGEFLVFYNQTPADATMTGLTLGVKGMLS